MQGESILFYFFSYFYFYYFLPFMQVLRVKNTVHYINRPHPSPSKNRQEIREIHTSLLGGTLCRFRFRLIDFLTSASFFCSSDGEIKSFQAVTEMRKLFESVLSIKAKVKTQGTLVAQTATFGFLYLKDQHKSTPFIRC